MELVETNNKQIVYRAAGIRAKIKCNNYTEFWLLKQTLEALGKLIDPYENFRNMFKRPWTAHPNYHKIENKRSQMSADLSKNLDNNPLTLYFNTIEDAKEFI